MREHPCECCTLLSCCSAWRSVRSLSRVQRADRNCSLRLDSSSTGQIKLACSKRCEIQGRGASDAESRRVPALPAMQYPAQVHACMLTYAGAGWSQQTGQGSSGAHHPEGERLWASYWLVPGAVQQLRHASPRLPAGKGAAAAVLEKIRGLSVGAAGEATSCHQCCVNQLLRRGATVYSACCSSWCRLQLQAAAACLCQGA